MRVSVNAMEKELSDKTHPQNKPKRTELRERIDQMKASVKELVPQYFDMDI
jgi:hypothetical protein